MENKPLGQPFMSPTQPTALEAKRMSTTPSAMAMRAAENIGAAGYCDVWRDSNDTLALATIIDNEFKELVEAAEEALNDLITYRMIEAGKHGMTFQQAEAKCPHPSIQRLKKALTHTTKGTHDKAE